MARLLATTVVGSYAVPDWDPVLQLAVTVVVPPERLWVNPDCGLNHLPRDIAFAKLTATTTGAKAVRNALPR